MVEVKEVREQYGVGTAEGAAGGALVTSGDFSENVQEFASGKSLILVDVPQLLRLVRGVQVSAVPTRVESAPELQPVRSVPAYPSCDVPMVLQSARRGRNAGKEFWVCSTHPKCKGIRNI